MSIIMRIIRTSTALNGELVRRYVLRHLRLSITVAVAAGLLSYFLTSLFPAIEPEAATSISASWPQLMKDLFGDPVFGFTDIYAWMNLELFHITLWMIFGVFAALLASDVIAKEVEAKSMDILLSTPVTRSSLILSRVVGLVLIMGTTIIPVYLGCILGALRLGYPLQPTTLLAASILLLLISLVFAVVTILVSVFVPKQTYAAVIAIAILAGMFLYEDLGKLVPVLKNLDYINPFHYYTPHDVLIYNTYSSTNALILLSMLAALVALSLITFSHRDIPQ